MIGGGNDGVLWRWPGSWREWLSAGARTAAPNPAVVGLVGLGVGFVTGFMTYNFLQHAGVAPPPEALPSPEPAGDLAAAVVEMLQVAAVMGALVLAAIGLGCLFAQRLEFTVDAVRLRRFPWRLRIVRLADIRHAVIHEGDGTVILRGDGGELLRARHVARAAEFAKALGAPTLVWPAREKTRSLERLIMAVNTSWFGAIFVIAPLVMIFLNIVGQGFFGYLGTVLITLACSAVLGPLLGTAMVVRLVRRFAAPENFEDFVGNLSDPARWRGRVPSRWGPIAPLARLSLRIAGIAPPPPLQPELRHGATLEMAEGAA